MLDRIQQWLRRKPGWSALAAEREAQSLRLELQAEQRRVALLAAELDRHQRGEAARLAEATRAQAERLADAAAAPVVQLLAQAHLLEQEGKAVPAKDVLAVARRLVQALAEMGLHIEGRAGDPVAFDPNRHEPLSSQDALAPGQPAVIRFVGVAFQGKLLRKAGVEPRKKSE